jgi:K+/H+ antiporter YhaU regulatory subunit KhtT
VASGSFITDTSARFVPKPVLHGIKLYHGWSEAIRLSLQGSVFLKTAKRPFTHIFIYFLLLNALIIAASFAAFHLPFGDDPMWRMNGQRLVWVAAAFLSIPAQVAVLRNINAITMILSEVSLGWSVLRPLAKGPPRELFRWGLFSVVFFVYAAVFLIACSRYFPTGVSLIVFVGVFVLFALVFWRRAIRVQSMVEFSLQEAMSEHGGSVVKASVEEAIRRISRQNPWPVISAEVEIPKGAVVVGKTIRDLNLRTATGTTITSIERGGVVHFDVTPAFPISPGDTMGLLGEQSQIEAATKLLREIRPKGFEEPVEKQSFAKVLVTANSELCGLTLRESNVRMRFNVTVVGIQRGEVRFTGPGPNEALHDGDLLLVMGAPADTERLGDALAGLDAE